MKLQITSALPMVLLIVGCSSTATNVSETGGAAGEASAAGMAGMAGSDTGGQAGSGSGGTSPGGTSTGGTSTGGVAGSNTGGTGGTCIPKTCLEIAIELSGNTSNPPKACGITNDGCNGYIDCGSKCSGDLYNDVHYSCGLDLAGPIDPNLCGSTCNRAPGGSGFGSMCPAKTWAVLCSNYNEEPYSGCTMSTTLNNYWCCP
jgi:hypothetical protein